MSTAEAPIMITFPFVCCYALLFYFLKKIFVYEGTLFSFYDLQEFTDDPHALFEYPINCYIVRG